MPSSEQTFSWQKTHGSILQDVLLAGAGATQLPSDTVPLLECMHCTSLVLTPPVHVGMGGVGHVRTVQIRNAVGEMRKDAVHICVRQAACLLVQALNEGLTMQRRGFDRSLSTNASKDTVRNVRMVEVADCKALLSLWSRCQLSHSLCALTCNLFKPMAQQQTRGFVIALHLGDLNCYC